MYPYALTTVVLTFTVKYYFTEKLLESTFSTDFSVQTGVRVA